MILPGLLEIDSSGSDGKFTMIATSRRKQYSAAGADVKACRIDS
jgi:hypothetical protein